MTPRGTFLSELKDLFIHLSRLIQMESQPIVEALWIGFGFSLRTNQKGECSADNMRAKIFYSTRTEKQKKKKKGK